MEWSRTRTPSEPCWTSLHSKPATLSCCIDISMPPTLDRTGHSMVTTTDECLPSSQISLICFHWIMLLYLIICFLLWIPIVVYFLSCICWGICWHFSCQRFFYTFIFLKYICFFLYRMAGLENGWNWLPVKIKLFLFCFPICHAVYI